MQRDADKQDFGHKKKSVSWKIEVAVIQRSVRIDGVLWWE